MALTWPDVKLVDISGYLESIDPLIDDAALDSGLKLKDSEFTLQGTWAGYERPVSELAVRVSLQGVKRLPRRTKKALKKYWRGRFRL